MPTMKTFYDKRTGEALTRFSVTADEAVKNDPSRYSFARPKAPVVVSAKDDAAARAAAKTKAGEDGGES